jgi:hypothetical protein
MTLTVDALAQGDVGHADANNRVCHNVNLPERERAECTRELAAAKTDADRTKVRKSYESKIAEIRDRKSGH